MKPDPPSIVSMIAYPLVVYARYGQILEWCVWVEVTQYSDGTRKEEYKDRRLNDSRSM